MSGTAKWIWHEGDFELHHHMKLSLSRRERGSIVPAFWKVFDCHRLVRFEKQVTLTAPETLHIDLDGVGYLMLGFRRVACDGPVRLEPGEHTLGIVVGSDTGIPAARVRGETIMSDETWLADAREGVKAPVGSMALPEGMTPTGYHLPQQRIEIAAITPCEDGWLVDFGRETYVRLVLDIAAPGCPMRVVYGESEEEARSDAHAVIREEIAHASGTVTLPATACRYARIVSAIQPENIHGLYEYLPLENHGAFQCDDDVLNRIYDVSEYTLRLNSRLFYLDGIKRDGWVWGGDAYQSYFLNYYTHDDRPLIQRTMLALRGGDPIVSHINGIVDYSLYWLIGLDDYCRYTGDEAFLRRLYARAQGLMAYCEALETDEGLLRGREGDWTFIDWADMEKNGALCCMQMLYCRALEAMAKCARIAGDAPSQARYQDKARTLRGRIKALYWSEAQGAYVTTYDKGQPSTQVRRHANIFALIFGFADEAMRRRIIDGVILNDAVPAISTPYFKFYELEALCLSGRMADVTAIIRSYWGGMLAEGATTFWEEYDPTMHGAEHYAMYREPFDKSLCHAWGASPLYLYGRYYLGVTPTADGWTEFEVRPQLGGLRHIKGKVPVAGGEVTVRADADEAVIRTNREGGWFVREGVRERIVPGVENRFAMR